MSDFRDGYEGRQLLHLLFYLVCLEHECPSAICTRHASADFEMQRTGKRALLLLGTGC